MRFIKEYKDGNKNKFMIQLFDDNKLVTSEDISYTSKVRRRNGKEFLCLYDSEMILIPEVFAFLNNEMEGDEINTRIRALSALKVLFHYQSIIRKELKDFTPGDINGLTRFMRGREAGGQELSFQLIRTRQNSTVNGYYSVYRRYCQYLGVQNEALSVKAKKFTYLSHPDTDQEIKVQKFKSNLPEPRFPIEVPRYISIDELRVMLAYIRQYIGLQAEIIIRLMFQCGLRIGEVLGLTADDLVMEKIDGSFMPVAYIRNRESDSKNQKAKTCIKVRSKEQYRSKEYIKYGWQRVIVPLDLYDLINNYIDTEHSAARKDKNSNYLKHAVADRVRESHMYEDDNYYIFINEQGRPLSQTLWNVTLRKVFKACGIIIDQNMREHNLNHRFRHGFAMYNIQHLNCKEIELAERMRHKSVRSVYKYFRPTISDTIKIKTDFIENLYAMIPELRR